MSSRTAEGRSAVIAIDGPGGSGKSTVAREVARRLGWRYLDTGAMYRAVALAVLEAGTDPADGEAVARTAARARVTVATDPAEPSTYLGDRLVSGDIRTRAVTNAVSEVSAVPAVRALLVEAQRALITGGEIVVEGRDIGTTVAPGAELKVFLTADAAARAARRHRDEDAPEADDLGVVHDEIRRRDALDSGRAASPLVKAEDAIELDTTDMSVDDVVRAILAEHAAIVGVRRPRSEVEA